MRDFSQLFLLLTVSTFLVSCQKTNQGPVEQASIAVPASDLPGPQVFRLDQGDRAVKETLRYSCNSSSTPSPSLSAPSEMGLAPDSAQWRKCLNQLPDQFDLDLEVDWLCQQSDLERLQRPLPSRATLRIPAHFRLQSSAITVVFDLTSVQSFLRPSYEGNTTYRACRTEAFAKASETLQQAFKKLTNKYCEQALFDWSIEQELFRQWAIVERPFVSREDSLVLLNPVLPFYDSISPAISPTLSSVSDLCSPFFERSYDDRSGTHVPSQDGVIIMGRQFIANQLALGLRQGTRCSIAAIGFLSPQNHLPSACRDNPETDQCPVYVQSLNALYEAIEKQMGDSAELGVRFRDWKHINDWSVQIRQLDRTQEPVCDLLPVGGAKIINTNGGAYRLLRRSEKELEVEINVAFRPDCESDEFENKRIARLWVDRVNQCFSKYRASMKGPNDQNISFRVLSESPAYGPQPHRISVVGSGETFRENTARYSSESDCPTLIHEVLHLTGLVDEYDGSSDGYGCRITGPKDSIMNSPRGACNQAEQTGQSLIKPAHFRFIAYPNCRSRNDVYYRCGQYAYERQTSSQCRYVDLPKECDRSFDWINN